MKINFLLEYSVDIPSMEEQLSIVDKLEKYILEKDNVATKLLRLNKIKKNYLDKYFGWHKLTL